MVTDLVASESADLRHHGDVEAGEGLLDFAVNVQGSSPPPWLADVLRAGVEDLGRYPDPSGARAALAELHGIPAESVLVTAGAAEAFTLAAALPWKHPLVVHPQFTEPEVALLDHGHQVDRVILSAANGFRLGGLASRLPREADLVVIGNPTNPTSRLHPPGEVAELLAPGRTVLVDEAFMDAVEAPERPGHSLVRRAASTPGLVVVRSLTKTFALAGLRVGYLVAQPETVHLLARRQPHWGVGSLACAAAVACAGASGRRHAAHIRADLPGRLEHLTARLQQAGLEVVEQPAGPFVLAHHPQADLLRKTLRDRGVAVRRCDTFPGLGPEWLRFAAREPHAVDHLAEALPRALTETETTPEVP